MRLVYNSSVRRVLAVAFLLALPGCAYHAPAEPSPITTPAPSPSHVTVQSTVGIGSSATNAFIAATVLDDNGHGVQGVNVTFSTTAGAVSPATTMTNSAGVAQTTLTSGVAATVTASAAGFSSYTFAGINAAIHPSLSAPSALTGATVNFSAFVTDATAPITYTWNFGDGATAVTSAGATTHAYGRPGFITTSVRVVDALGRSADAVGAITISDPPAVVVTPPVVTPPPTLSATMNCSPATHGTPTPCNLSATYGTTALASNAITSVTWDYGDGTGATVAGSPLTSRTYVQAGTFIVTAAVTATTTDGAKTGVTSKTLIIP